MLILILPMLSQVTKYITFALRNKKNARKEKATEST